MTLEETLVSVWQQILVERAGAAEIDGVKHPALRTSTNRLWQVDFNFEGRPLRGVEQNPNTKSRWAQLARSGKRVMHSSMAALPRSRRGRQSHALRQSENLE